MSKVAQRALLSLTLGLASIGVAAKEPRQSEPTQAQIAERMCNETKCQRNLHVVLKKKDGSIYDQTFPIFPAIVQNEGILVVAGQTVYVEAELSNGKLINLRAVDSITHPDKTLTVKLEQMPDGGMMLSTSNPFDALLKFDMGMMPLDSDDLLKTSSCPVLKGSFEMWPYPILQVYLGAGHEVSKDQMLCE